MTDLLRFSLSGLALILAVSAGCSKPPAVSSTTAPAPGPAPVTAPDPTPAETPDSAPAEMPYPTEVTSNAGGYVVRFSTDPGPIPINEYFTMVVEVEPADGDAEGIDLVVDARMPDHAHGMNTKPKVERQADGSFSVRGMLFHMSGYWELYFDITDGDRAERAEVPVEMD